MGAYGWKLILEILNYPLQPTSGRLYFAGLSLRNHCTSVVFSIHCARNHCSDVFGGHWALAMSARTCFEAIQRSKSLLEQASFSLTAFANTALALPFSHIAVEIIAPACSAATGRLKSLFGCASMPFTVRKSLLGHASLRSTAFEIANTGRSNLLPGRASKPCSARNH